MNIRVVIDSGICGFQTSVQAESADGQFVGLKVTSSCEKVQGCGQAIMAHGAIDAYAEIGSGAEGVVLRTARQHLTGCCAGCVVPAGLFKAVQVAGGVALPRDIAIQMAVA